MDERYLGNIDENLKYDYKFLLDTFKEKLMVIYREILLEGRIVIVSKTKSVSEVTNIIKAL